MSTYKTIILEKREGVARVTLNRPQVLNAINWEMISELSTALKDIRDDGTVKVVVITGAGERAFSVGADVSMLKEASSPAEVRSLIRTAVDEVVQAIANLEKPVIAWVNALALGGGCELAMACDMVIAAETARFGQPEINLGVLPGWGGMSRLAQIVGIHKAKELVFTGDMISAREAERLGLANKVVPLDKLEATVNKIVNKLLNKSPMALKLAKEAMNRGTNINISTALSRDIETFCLCFSTEDAREGIRAFLEKRKPVFKGK